MIRFHSLIFVFLLPVSMIGVTSCKLFKNLSSMASENGASGTYPACQQAGSDPDGDGWGWENNQSCKVVVVEQGFPVCQSPESDPDRDGWGWENNRSCKVLSQIESDLSIWPNTKSQANSDAWLREHHDEIKRLQPRVLILLANNTTTPEAVRQAADRVVEAFAEGSRYQGYHDASAQPQLQYQIDKIVDLRDNSGQDWPAIWPVNLQGEYWQQMHLGPLFSQDFAKQYGYEDPKDPSRFLTLCELFEQGYINELWTQAPRYKQNPLGVYEAFSRAQVYDQSMQPITGKFERCAGNGCMPEDVAQECKVTIRLAELAIDRGPGCLTHGNMHGMEGLRKAIPYYETNSANFFKPYKETQNNGEGCGNAHFPPNGRNDYDYDNTTPAMSNCENFAMFNGGDGKDAKSSYAADMPIIKDYESRYGDCGGGWQIYLRQSMPGFANSAKALDGSQMKSWWPFMFY